jgi:hypothetical protein
MPPAVNALMLAGLLLLPAVSRAAPAQLVPDTSSLQFFGFRAGARLAELDLHLRGLGSSPLRCRRARADRRVSECRTILSDPDLGNRVTLWVSAIDSAAGVMTLSGVVAPGQLERWRNVLQDGYGEVGKRVQGTQSMLQWVRRGRMIRLTWRLEAGEKVASVSLVDGRVLDEWGRAQIRTAIRKPPDSSTALSSRAGPDSSPPSPPACSPERLGPTPSGCAAAPAPESGSVRRRQRGLAR